MANLQKQIDALTAYFQADCARPGVLPIALTIEHFITRLDGTPVDYAQLAQVIYSMQGHDEPLREDNVYLGFRCPSYTITIQAGCQVTISLAPYPTVLQAMAVYEGCFTRLCNALAANNMYARTVGVHPSRRAELLPLVPQSGYMIMDRYFRNTGNQGGVMLRATASTRVTIRYTSEADFVRKFRVACLITPLLALLTDNVPLYQGESNHNYSIHTHIWNNVDPDRCGIYPNVMDSNFGFESYAAHILQQPLVVARHGARIVGVLHLLGVCMMLYPVYRRLPTPALAAIGIVLVVAGYLIAGTVVRAKFLFPLGLLYEGFTSSDYFPLLPHLGWYMLGTVLGRTVYADKKTRLPGTFRNSGIARFFCWCGRQSLFIYLLHQPIVYGLLELIASLKR